MTGCFPACECCLSSQNLLCLGQSHYAIIPLNECNFSLLWAKTWSFSGCPCVVWVISEWVEVRLSCCCGPACPWEVALCVTAHHTALSLEPLCWLGDGAAGLGGEWNKVAVWCSDNRWLAPEVLPKNPSIAAEGAGQVERISDTNSASSTMLWGACMQFRTQPACFSSLLRTSSGGERNFSFIGASFTLATEKAQMARVTLNHT